VAVAFLSKIPARLARKQTVIPLPDLPQHRRRKLFRSSYLLIRRNAYVQVTETSRSHVEREA